MQNFQDTVSRQPHNLKTSLIFVTRKSSLSSGNDGLVSVWLSLPQIERSEPTNIFHRQGICLGEGLTQAEADGWIDEYCAQLGLDRRQYLKEPLVYPVELMAVRCEGIAMDADGVWCMHATVASVVDGDGVWISSYAMRINVDFFPCVARLSEQVKRQRIDWRQTWISKPSL